MAGSNAVVEGWDCDDTNPTLSGAVTFPATGECFADDNLDGVADCALDATGSWVTVIQKPCWISLVNRWTLH